MEVIISGRHVAVTDAMRDRARERTEKLAEASTHLMRAKVTLSIESGRQIAEIICSVRKHGEIVAKCESHDMYAAIDDAVAKIEKQIRKIEDRYRTQRDAARQKRTLEGRTAIERETESAASEEEEDE